MFPNRCWLLVSPLVHDSGILAVERNYAAIAPLQLQRGSCVMSSTLYRDFTRDVLYGSHSVRDLSNEILQFPFISVFAATDPSV